MSAHEHSPGYVISLLLVGLFIRVRVLCAMLPEYIPTVGFDSSQGAMRTRRPGK